MKKATFLIAAIACGLAATTAELKASYFPVPYPYQGNDERSFVEDLRGKAELTRCEVQSLRLRRLQIQAGIEILQMLIHAKNIGADRGSILSDEAASEFQQTLRCMAADPKTDRPERVLANAIAAEISRIASYEGLTTDLSDDEIRQAYHSARVEILEVRDREAARPRLLPFDPDTLTIMPSILSESGEINRFEKGQMLAASRIEAARGNWEIALEIEEVAERRLKEQCIKMVLGEIRCRENEAERADNDGYCLSTVHIYKRHYPEGELFRELDCSGSFNYHSPDVDQIAFLAATGIGDPGVAVHLTRDRALAPSLDPAIVLRLDNQSLASMRRSRQAYARMYLDAATNLSENAEEMHDVFMAAQWAMLDETSEKVVQASVEWSSENVSPELLDTIREFSVLREYLGRKEEFDISFAAPVSDPYDPSLSAEENASLKAVHDREQAELAQRRRENDLRARVEAEMKRLSDAEKRERYNQLAQTIEASYPQFFDFIVPEPIALAEVQASLDAEEAIVIIVQGITQTHVFVVSANSVRLARSDLTSKQAWQMVGRLLWDAGSDIPFPEEVTAIWSLEGEGESRFARSVAHTLYNKLFGGIEAELVGKKRVFISADGVLSSLPFGLLVTSPPLGADGDPEALRQTDWLADRFALSQLSSISSMRLMTEAASASSGPEVLTGFGNPILDGVSATRGLARRSAPIVQSSGSAEGEQVIPLVERLRALSALPGTETELLAIRDALSESRADIRLGARATEAAFKFFDFEDTSLLAIATHGLVPSQMDGLDEAGLVFTPPSNGNVLDNGVLTASEIAALKIPVDWVFLSACNTAVDDGANITSLTNAFFFAGAQSVVASHWPVDDIASASLTSAAVRIWRDNPELGRAESLQRAMREVRMDSSQDERLRSEGNRSWAHPSIWAPFSLFGDL